MGLSRKILRMPEVHRFALVPYSPLQMFELVRDVRRYPEFLDWVRDAVVHEEDEERQMATLEVRLAGLVRRFTTLNELAPGRAMNMQLHEGPFDDLSGRWWFESVGEGTRVSLDLKFRVPGSMLLKPFQRNFGRMADRMVGDFSRRAESVYG